MNCWQSVKTSGSCSFENIEKPTSVFTIILVLICQISWVKVSWIDTIPNSLWYLVELGRRYSDFHFLPVFRFHADVPWYFFLLLLSVLRFCVTHCSVTWGKFPKSELSAFLSWFELFYLCLLLCSAFQILHLSMSPTVTSWDVIPKLIKKYSHQDRRSMRLMHLVMVESIWFWLYASKTEVSIMAPTSWWWFCHVISSYKGNLYILDTQWPWWLDCSWNTP